ncbi:beta-ketoacyl-ACP synthase II [uncultured Rikenella sp.]|uniref:beta-ketoacyl-ACP synthase II n=1 Tax=uncultured Rikenella sp. TaxID=368003 RepID=UPI002608D013|nr:beta-ketoacyl-ACP synthase II [uncultured Rikenella sp.]
MKLRRVVVTGIGTINPLGHNIGQYFENLEKGISGAAPITHFDASKFKTQFACEVKGFDPNEHFDRKEARKYDRFTQFALVAAKEALQDSGLVGPEGNTSGDIDLDQVGAVWASGIGGIETVFNEVMNFAKGDGTPKYNPFFIPKMIADIAAGHISMKYGFRGPNYCTVSACSSSNHAFIDALNLIRWGKADIIVSGGSEAAINPAGIGGFNAMQALSTRNDDPATASRPYDTGRDGFVMGEGAGALILEEYEHAKARGVKIYAEVVGGGMSADAYHLTAPHPDGAGAARAMQEAFKDAGISPEEVDYINTHGTSTPAGDIPELTGIKAVLGDHIYRVNISSTKSMTGHLLGGAAAIEALACIMAIDKGIVPPTINVTERDPQIDPRIDLTLGHAVRREVNCALSNTFGFGGHNSTVIFKKVND